MYLNEKKVGMVRVVVAISNKYSGCLSTDPEDCEERGNILCHGFWHRHDDKNLENILDSECKSILNAYRTMDHYSGAMFGVEWKDYRR